MPAHSRRVLNLVAIGAEDAAIRNCIGQVVLQSDSRLGTIDFAPHQTLPESWQMRRRKCPHEKSVVSLVLIYTDSWRDFLPKHNKRLGYDMVSLRGSHEDLAYGAPNFVQSAQDLASVQGLPVIAITNNPFRQTALQRAGCTDVMSLDELLKILPDRIGFWMRRGK